MDFDELANRYRGATAKQYDTERNRSAKWDGEQATLAAMIGSLERGSSVVDIPVGTGRCFEWYAQHGLRVTGLDISPDMLAEARVKAESLGLPIELEIGDIRKIDAADGSIDTVVCIRFLNWVDLASFRAIVGELVRVSRSDLILAVRHYAPLADLEIPSVRGAKRLARQLYRRVQKRLSKPGLVIHEKRQVEDVFASHHLDVVTAPRIQQRSDGNEPAEALGHAREAARDQRRFRR